MLRRGTQEGGERKQMLTGDALFERVQRYFAFGDHRTASPGDYATTDWLQSALSDNGYTVTRNSFLIDRFEPGPCSLKTAGRVFDLHPQWPAPLSLPAQAEGALALLDMADSVPADVTGRIVVARANPPVRGSLEVALLHDWLCQVEKAAAVVLITEGPSGDVVPFNTRFEQKPYKCPVALMAPKEATPLISAARSGVDAVLCMEGAISLRVPAHNLFAQTSEAPPSVIISTPQSGWFGCAAERGPGIALLLGLAEWASAEGHAQIGFVVTSGHELGDRGAHQLLKAPPFDPQAVNLWFHLGAGIAAYDWAFPEDAPPHRLPAPYADRFLVTNDAALLEPLQQSFAGAPGLETPHHVSADQLHGETGVYMSGPVDRVVGVLCGHPFHHTPKDTPVCTGPDLLAPVGAALVAFLERFMALQAAAQ